jgi:hypothetical protein
MNNHIEKIIELHEAIDFLIDGASEMLQKHELEEIYKQVEGAEITCRWFEERDNTDRIVYELTTLRDWLILYVRGITEF